MVDRLGRHIPFRTLSEHILLTLLKLFRHVRLLTNDSDAVLRLLIPVLPVLFHILLATAPAYALAEGGLLDNSLAATGSQIPIFLIKHEKET